MLGLQFATINGMLAILKRTYCGTFAVEFMHIADAAEKSWIQARIEGPDKEIAFTPEGKRAILKKLIEGEAFERFAHKRYPGTKRFGIDGGEAMLPALEQIIKRGGQMGVEQTAGGVQGQVARHLEHFGGERVWLNPDRDRKGAWSRGRLGLSGSIRWCASGRRAGG